MIIKLFINYNIKNYFLFFLNILNLYNILSNYIFKYLFKRLIIDKNYK